MKRLDPTGDQPLGFNCIPDIIDREVKNYVAIPTPSKWW